MQHPSQQHPSQGTGIFKQGDTSIDTSYNKVQDESDLSEPREVKAIFGEIGRDNQGAVGVPVPDEDEPENMVEFEDVVNDVEYRYSDEPDAPEDAIGPVPRIGHIGSFSLDELTKNNEAAVAASVAAQLHGCKSTEMFDALEKAEAAAEATHLPFPLLLEHQGDSSSIAKESGSTTFHVHDTLRHKVVQKIAAALGANSHFVGGDATASAKECEDAVFNSSKSLTVYQSIAANAIRVAESGVDQLPEVLRVARGQPHATMAAMPVVGQNTKSSKKEQQ